MLRFKFASAYSIRFSALIFQNFKFQIENDTQSTLEYVYLFCSIRKENGYFWVSKYFLKFFIFKQPCNFLIKILFSFWKFRIQSKNCCTISNIYLSIYNWLELWLVLRINEAESLILLKWMHIEIVAFYKMCAKSVNLTEWLSCCGRFHFDFPNFFPLFHFFVSVVDSLLLFNISFELQRVGWNAIVTDLRIWGEAWTR